MNLNQALELVRTSTPEQLRSMSQQDMLTILMNLSPEERGEFIFAKNIKLFGGINNYINDVFAKQTVEKIGQIPSGPNKEAAKAGLRQMLEKMITYSDVSQENIQRIQTALSTTLSPTGAAAAAGGMYESLPQKLCNCIKKVKRSYKNKNEKRAIPICIKSVLHTKGKTLKKFSCRNGPKLETKPWSKK